MWRSKAAVSAAVLWSLLRLVSCGGESGEDQAPGGDVADSSALDAGPSEDTAGDDGGAWTDSGGSVEDTALGDTALGDAAQADVSQPDTTLSDTASGDSAQVDGGGIAGPYGFSLRKPTEHVLPCKESNPMNPTKEIKAKDSDWVCSLLHGKVDAHIYLQATPTKCVQMGFKPGPSFESQAWISWKGKVEPLAKAYYNLGGGHQNDWIEVDHDSVSYKLYHSSFGYGWRKCQEMDCVQILTAFAGKVVEDGCTKDRKLPIVCRRVQPDGTVAPLIDTFKPCKGDPNHP